MPRPGQGAIQNDLSLYLLWKFPEFPLVKKQGFVDSGHIHDSRFFLLAPCVETASANDVLALDSLERQGTKDAFLGVFWVDFSLGCDKKRPHVLSSSRRWCPVHRCFLEGNCWSKKEAHTGGSHTFMNFVESKGFYSYPSLSTCSGNVKCVCIVFEFVAVLYIFQTSNLLTRLISLHPNIPKNQCFSPFLPSFKLIFPYFQSLFRWLAQRTTKPSSLYESMPTTRTIMWPKKRRPLRLCSHHCPLR